MNRLMIALAIQTCLTVQLYAEEFAADHDLAIGVVLVDVGEAEQNLRDIGPEGFDDAFRRLKLEPQSEDLTFTAADGKSVPACALLIGEPSSTCSAVFAKLNWQAIEDLFNATLRNYSAIITLTWLDERGKRMSEPKRFPPKGRFEYVHREDFQQRISWRVRIPSEQVTDVDINIQIHAEPVGGGEMTQTLTANMGKAALGILRRSLADKSAHVEDSSAGDQDGNDPAFEERPGK